MAPCLVSVRSPLLVYLLALSRNVSTIVPLPLNKKPKQRREVHRARSVPRRAPNLGPTLSTSFARRPRISPGSSHEGMHWNSSPTCDPAARIMPCGKGHTLIPQPTMVDCHRSSSENEFLGQALLLDSQDRRSTRFDKNEGYERCLFSTVFDPLIWTLPHEVVPRGGKFHVKNRKCSPRLRRDLKNRSHDKGGDDYDVYEAMRCWMTPSFAKLPVVLPCTTCDDVYNIPLLTDSTYRVAT